MGCHGRAVSRSQEMVLYSTAGIFVAIIAHEIIPDSRRAPIQSRIDGASTTPRRIAATRQHEAALCLIETSHLQTNLPGEIT